VAAGGYYGSNRVTRFTAEPDAANWSMSFTDVYTSGGQGNFEGLDDFQDRYGCSDEWTPKADRGKSSFIMVR
jgi:hypothetical protein